MRVLSTPRRVLVTPKGSPVLPHALQQPNLEVQLAACPSIELVAQALLDIFLKADWTHLGHLLWVAVAILYYFVEHLKEEKCVDRNLAELSRKLVLVLMPLTWGCCAVWWKDTDWRWLILFKSDDTDFDKWKAKLNWKSTNQNQNLFSGTVRNILPGR